jgi:hypothetical protein
MKVSFAKGIMLAINEKVKNSLLQKNLVWEK